MRESAEVAMEQDPAPMRRPPALPFGVDLVRRVPAIELSNDAPYADDPLAWLEREARTAPHLAAIIDGLVQRLRRAGVALARLTIHIGTVHPQLLGYGWFGAARKATAPNSKSATPHSATPPTNAVRCAWSSKTVRSCAAIHGNPKLRASSR